MINKIFKVWASPNSIKLGLVLTPEQAGNLSVALKVSSDNRKDSTKEFITVVTGEFIDENQDELHIKYS